MALHWRTIDSLFDSKSGLTTRRKRGGRWEYRILATGCERVTATGSDFLLIEPEKALQGVRTVHSIIGAVVGQVRLCDPYLDHVSIEHLSVAPAAVPLHILTVNIYDQPRVRRLLAAARTEGRTIEVRTLPAGHLHDRYLIDDASFFILGTSLNSVGKKQSFLIRGGTDVRAAVLASFDAKWARAAPWS